MKKSILIFCIALTTFSLAAISYISWSNNEKSLLNNTFNSGNDNVNTIVNPVDFNFIYNVDSRYLSTITKEKLDNATSFIEIFPGKATKGIESWQTTEVVILHDEDKTIEAGNGNALTSAQLNLFKSTDYSSNFYITANCKKRNSSNDRAVADSIVYWMTIVPKNEAEYVEGNNNLIKYLKENSKEKIAIVNEDRLQPGRVNFTVTKEGTIEAVKLTSTSNYESVDKVMIDLISNIPGKWHPATNWKGERVNQEFVFFFGMQGC